MLYRQRRFTKVVQEGTRANFPSCESFAGNSRLLKITGISDGGYWRTQSGRPAWTTSGPPSSGRLPS